MLSLNRSVAVVYRWLRPSPLAMKGCVPRSIAAAIALSGALYCAPSGADPSGYASLVRRVAPSVVTILVEEAPVGAGQRAAAQARARDYDSMQAAIRRLLSGSNSDQ